MRTATADRQARAEIKAALVDLETARVRLAAVGRRLQAMPQHQAQDKTAQTWAAWTGDTCQHSVETVGQLQASLRRDLRYSDRTMALMARREARSMAAAKKRNAKRRASEDTERAAYREELRKLREVVEAFNTRKGTR